MEILTKQEAIRRHRELWNKIAEMMARNKQFVTEHEALEELGYKECPDFDCWCCQYRADYAYNMLAEYSCDNCPIEWEVDDCTCDNSLYRQYFAIIDDIDKIDEAIRLAKAIASLPEKEQGV